MKNVIAVFLFVFTLASAAFAAQISGTLQCEKPDPQYTIPGNHDHSVLISQYKCTWTKPMQVEGVATKDGLSIEAGRKTGNHIDVNGFHTTNMESKDQIYAIYDGKTTLNNDKPASAMGNFKFDGGTGKFEKIKGSGHFTGKGTPDGGVIFDVKGQYTIGN